MKKFWKQYKGWTLPSKMTLWGLLFTMISTPSAIITYLQFYGNDDIASKTYKLLQVNSRAHLKVLGMNYANYPDDGKTLVLNIENVSSFWAKNMKSKVSLLQDLEFSGQFNNNVLKKKNLGIPPKTVKELAIFPMKQFVAIMDKIYPQYEIADIVLLNQQSEKSGLPFSFAITVSYLTEGGERTSQTIALNAILRDKAGV